MHAFLHLCVHVQAKIAIFYIFAIPAAEKTISHMERKRERARERGGEREREGGRKKWTDSVPYMNDHYSPQVDVVLTLDE